jgi:phosphoribosylaminoimidazole carboxylase
MISLRGTGRETDHLDDLLINEIAPRPHNSGHYTIEGCGISQYEAHLSAILKLPIHPESTQLATSSTYAAMINLLGDSQADSYLQTAYMAKSIPMARVHLYGKDGARPGRKMGHVTILANSAVELEERVKPLVDFIDQRRAEGESAPCPAPPLPRTETQQRLDSSSTPKPLPDSKAETSLSNYIDSHAPLVAITMGSDSDRFVLADGIRLLEKLQIPHFVTITSAHRTPKRMTNFAEEAVSKGFKVIIAAAGGAAHLPGMIAASTELPVIGVPIKGQALDGMDSLLSIVQMPVRPIIRLIRL